MKYFPIFLTICLFTVGSGGTFCSAQTWRQIEPIKSTRADVERIFGTTKEAYFSDYELKDGKLFIEYSSGPCRVERKGGWNVAENTVVLVSFTPKKKKRVKALKLDLQKFQIVVDKHVGGIIYYINEEDGITYEVQNGKIDSIEYGPGKRYISLYCGDPANFLETNLRNLPAINRF